MTIKAGQIVKVKWRDSATAPGWVKKREITGAEPVESAGIVIENRPDTLILSTSEAGAICLDPLSIPWGAIEHVEELE